MPLTEEQLLALFQKFTDGTLSNEELRCLKELALHNKDIRSMLSYLEEQQPSAEELLDAEISYTKTRPNDLMPKSEKSIKFPLKNLLIVAAALLILSFTIHYRGLFINIGSSAEDWDIVHTDKGQRKFFRLLDGSEIWLNNESELRVKKGFGSQHRELALRGEAYFSAGKNKKLPLRVHTEQAIVEVLGTVFNVRAYPEEKHMETSLLEGRVKLTMKDDLAKHYSLIPGDRVRISKTSAADNSHKSGLKMQVDYIKLDLKNKNSTDFTWIDNKLSFQADPLPMMITKLSRWYDRTIILQTDRLDMQLFTGTFQEKYPEEVLDIIKKMGVKLNYSVTRDTIYIN